MLIYNAIFVFGLIFSYWSHKYKNTNFKVIQFLTIFSFSGLLCFCLANVNLVLQVFFLFFLSLSGRVGGKEGFDLNQH